MDPAALAPLEQPIVALVDERYPSDVRCAALDVMAAFAPETLEKHRPLLFEHIDVVRDTNGAALRAIGALEPPLNRDFARQLAALTEHLRRGDLQDRENGFKALLSLSGAQLSFCTQLVMASLTTQLRADSETTSSAVLLLGRIWLGRTLEVPKAPEE